MAEFVTNTPVLFSIGVSTQRDASRSADRLHHSRRVHGSELVCQAQIDVVPESSLIRSVVTLRIERLEEVSLAIVSVFGTGRECH